VCGVSITSREKVFFKFIVNQLSSDPEEVIQFAIQNYEGWSDNKFTTKEPIQIVVILGDFIMTSITCLQS